MTGRSGAAAFAPALVLLAVFAFMVWANLVTPLWGDDYCRITSPDAVRPFVVAWHDYFAWSGRFFVFAITYFVMAVGRAWSMVPFDVLNALVFLALIGNVRALARLAAGLPRETRADPLAVAVEMAFVFLLLWWLPRDVAEVALWKTGAVNYLWAMTGELWVLRRMLAPPRAGQGWTVPVAFLVATFLESLSAMMSLLLAGLCLLRWRRREPVPLLPAAAHLAGTLVVALAPGNFARAGVLARSPPLDRLAGVFGNLGSLFDAYWLPAVGVVAWAYASGGAGVATDGWRVLRAGRGWLFVVLALVYMASLLGVPRAALAARACFPASVFLVCYLTALFLRRPAPDASAPKLAAVLALLSAAHLAVVVPHLRALARIDAAWAADPQLRQGPAAQAVLPLVRVGGRTLYARKDRFFEGLTPDPANFINRCYAQAMGVGSVVARPQ